MSTGFSPGNATVNDENDVAKYFLGFWKNFMSTFDLTGRKVYITGESYAGQYVRNIAEEDYHGLELIYSIDPLHS